MPRRILLGVLVVASLSWTSLAWGETFDKPVRTQRVDLGPSPYLQSHSHARVTCSFFADFMVKEVDMREKGAERLGIVRVTPQSTGKCTRARSKEELVIPAEEWSGYFIGVKKGFVFFSGDDGWNGADEFAVFDAKTGDKLFEDAAKPFNSLNARKTNISFVTGPDQTLVMRYMRVVGDDCSLLKDASCWQRMAAKYGLGNAAAPDCQPAYRPHVEQEAKELCSDKPAPLSACMENERPRALKQVLEWPSVISYPVEVELSATPSIKPTGATTGCWPAD